MKKVSARVSMPLQLAIMLLLLTAGGAFLLIGQQKTPPVPSEEADWPWKVINEGKLFLNGAPAGQLSDPRPLFKKIFDANDLLFKKKAIGEYDRPSVFIVADPQISMRRIAMLWEGIKESNGGPFLITSSALSQLSDGGKPNPRATVVTTEDVDPGVVAKLSRQKAGDVETAAERISLYAHNTSTVEVRTRRTYENSIEIASDGKYYLNEKNGVYKAPPNMNPNINAPTPPVIPLKQRPLTRAELLAAVKKAIDTTREGHQDLSVIASENAPLQSILTLIETINDPSVEYAITVRLLNTWSAFDY